MADEFADYIATKSAFSKKMACLNVRQSYERSLSIKPIILFYKPKFRPQNTQVVKRGGAIGSDDGRDRQSVFASIRVLADSQSIDVRFRWRKFITISQDGMELL